MDGLEGFKETVTNIVDAEVDLVLHGGDLFHRSAPGVGEIAIARQQLERFAKNGIPVIGATGNHDYATDRGKSSATAAVHDHDRKIDMVTGAYKKFHPTSGLNIQVVSHAGLIGLNRVVPTPVDGEISIFMTHGAAQVPGSEVFTCVDSPGEAVVGFDLLSAPWAATLLGHYHKRGPLPGFNQGPTGQVWYAGSLLRRGFSDPPCGRGWLLIEVQDDNSVVITPQNVGQRAQEDLLIIDAAGLTGADVEERIRANLSTVDLSTEPILRQRVINCPVAVRRGVDTHALREFTDRALIWQLEFFRPPLGDFVSENVDAPGSSIATAGGADLPATWNTWFDGYANSVSLPDVQRSEVAESGETLLRQVSDKVETITDVPATVLTSTPETAEIL